MEYRKATPCACARERKIASRLPSRYLAANLGHFSIETNQAVLRWLACPADGLLITGSVGTGKTHLAAAMSRHLLEAGTDAVFRRWAQFYADMRETYRTNASEASILRPLIGAGFLVMDDLGAGSLTDHERRSTLELMRQNENRPTIVTTNWNVAKISQVMDDRIASRLAGFTCLELLGRDLRTRQKQ
jgi:DNA replication protein DnaC